MKKVLFLLIILVSLFILASCSIGSGNNPGTEGGSGNNSGAEGGSDNNPGTESGSDLCEHVPGMSKSDNLVAQSCITDESYDLVTYCSKCNEEMNRSTIITKYAYGHTEAEPIFEYSKENQQNEYVVYCRTCKAKISAVPHIDEGLVFELDASEQSYCVSDYTGCKEHVVIPAYYDGKPVTSIGMRAFQYCLDLTNITIPSTIISIGSGAFYECYNLTSITIPNSVTTIGDDTFYRCYDLTSITIPSSVTSIGSGAFYECYDLTSITIPDSVTSIGMGAFHYCDGLTSIAIPNSVTSIGSRAFQQCSSLTSITIPNSVTSIGSEAFYQCYELTSVIFENPNGWCVTQNPMATGGTNISANDIRNPETAATYLKDTYYDYYWRRS